MPLTRRKAPWQRLISGLYVPPYLGVDSGGPHGCCCDCGCDQCDGGRISCCYRIVISGISNDTCDVCDCLNRKYLLRTTSTSRVEGRCRWSGWFSSYDRDCDGVNIRMDITAISDDRYEVSVYIGDGFVARYKWAAIYDARPDCIGFQDEELPFVESYNADCNADESTCLINAYRMPVAEAAAPGMGWQVTKCGNVKCDENEFLCLCDSIPVTVEVTIEALSDLSGIYIAKYYLWYGVCGVFGYPCTNDPPDYCNGWLQVRYYRDAESYWIRCSISSYDGVWQYDIVDDPFDCLNTDVELTNPSYPDSLIRIKAYYGE